MDGFNVENSYDLSATNRTSLKSTMSADKLKNKVDLFDVTIEEPSNFILNKFKGKLLSGASSVTFEDKYNYKPSFLAYEKYGDVNLSFILMFINNIPSKREFNNKVLKKILVPSASSVVLLKRYLETNQERTHTVIGNINDYVLYKM